MNAFYCLLYSKAIICNRDFTKFICIFSAISLKSGNLIYIKINKKLNKYLLHEQKEMEHQLYIHKTEKDS